MMPGLMVVVPTNNVEGLAGVGKGLERLGVHVHTITQVFRCI